MNARRRVATRRIGDVRDRIAGLTADLLGMPTAFASLVGRERLRLAGRFGVEASSPPREDALCGHTIAGEGPLIVPNTRKDPRFARKSCVTGARGMRFYAGAPLVCPIGDHHIGAFCVTDTRPRPFLFPEQMALLTSLAALVMDDMEQRRTEARQVA